MCRASADATWVVRLLPPCPLEVLDQVLVVRLGRWNWCIAHSMIEISAYIMRMTPLVLGGRQAGPTDSSDPCRSQLFFCVFSIPIQLLHIFTTARSSPKY